MLLAALATGVAVSNSALGVPTATGATLYISTDHDVFGGGSGGHIAVTHTSGATVINTNVLTTSFPVNGLALGAGNAFFYAGNPDTNILRTSSLTGSQLSSVTGTFPNTCCNEAMVFDGTNLWHVFYHGEIDKLNPSTGAVISTFAQSGMVGITLVGSTLWLSDYDTGDIGTWNPGTNTFTPVFNTGVDSGPGAMAFDPANNILWIGFVGGSVVPFSLSGTALNAGFQPFGDISDDEIDGMALASGTTPPPTTPAPPALLLYLTGLAGLAMFLAISRRRHEAD